MAAKKKRSTNAAPARAGRWPGIWMNAAALLAGVLTTAAVARLFFYGAAWQLGLIVGVCVGLIATSLAWAPAVAVAAVAAGLSIVLGSFDPATLSLPALIVAIVAPTVCWIVRRWPKTRAWIAYAVIGLIAANMWATTIYVSFPWTSGGTAQFVATSPKVGESWLDNDFYRRVLWLMRGGKGYYEAYRQGFNENARWGFDPPSVVSYRLPTAFWFWAALPGGPAAMFVAWLVLSTGALVSSVRIALHRLPVAFAIPAVAALTTYFVYNGTTTNVLLTEPWAAALGLLCVAAYIESFDSPSWQKWTVLAAAVALTACLVRELMVYVPVAGLLAALIAGGEQRRFRALAWGVALAVFAGAYALHVAAIGGAVSGVASERAFSSGGLAFLARAFFWGVKVVGGGGATVVTLAVMAAVGIVLLRERSQRVFLALAVALPFCAFLLFGNDAVDASGKATNYWGIVIVPLLIALSPWGFAAVPGAARAGIVAGPPPKGETTSGTKSKPQ
jgi:hypothetical protein